MRNSVQFDSTGKCDQNVTSCVMPFGNRIVPWIVCCLSLSLYSLPSLFFYTVSWFSFNVPTQTVFWSMLGVLVEPKNYVYRSCPCWKKGLTNLITMLWRDSSVCMHVCMRVCVGRGGGVGKCGFVGMSSLTRIVLSVGKHTLICICHYASL